MFRENEKRDKGGDNGTKGKEDREGRYKVLLFFRHVFEKEGAIRRHRALEINHNGGFSGCGAWSDVGDGTYTYGTAEQEQRDT